MRTDRRRAGLSINGLGPSVAQEDGVFDKLLDRIVVRALRALELNQSHVVIGWITGLEREDIGSTVRVRGESGAEGRDSAVAALGLGLDVVLRLLAPFLPYVTEELWRSRHHRSIHRAPWPGPANLAHVAPPDDAGSLARAAAMMSAINRAKTERGASVGRVVTELALGAHPATLARLPPIIDDVLAAARCPPAAAVLLERPDLPEDTFAVVRLQVQAAERKAPAQTDRC